MGRVIPSGSGDQQPGGREGRSGRKRRRSWTRQQQPAIRPKPTLPYEQQPRPEPPRHEPRGHEQPRQEPLTNAIPAAPAYPGEDQRRTQPVRRQPPPTRNWRDVPPPRRNLPPAPPPETYGPDGYAQDYPVEHREAHR